MKTTQQLLLGLLLTAGVLLAQDGPRGHWTGTIQIPDQPLAVEIDLDKTAGGWIGSIAIPSQNVSGLPLEAITFSDGKWTFRIKGAPGAPSFTGSLSADGKTLSGSVTQAGGSIPFSVSRVGDAKVEEIKKSPAVAKEFLGTWEGTLEVGQALRIVFKIANNENGASAVLVTVDQGGLEIPVTAIEQQGAKLTLVAKSIGGEYRGEINKDGTELNGTWMQSGNELPLNLKRKGSEPAKP
jgi:hypothetical protein